MPGFKMKTTIRGRWFGLPLAMVLLAPLCGASGDLRLLDAVKRRDAKALAALLGQHADVNAAQPDGATALAWAAFLGDDKAADLLLAAGAKVNVANEYGETPLTLACANGDAALAVKLLKAGANANAARWDGETALMIAAGAGSAETVERLVENGADLNAVESRKGQNALMWAASEGHADVVRTLIKHGANVKAASKSGFTPLVFAAVKNDLPSVQALLAAGADANYALPDGSKVLTVAASWHSTSVATALLDGGADPNAADRAGNTLLHTAAQLGDVDLVKALIAKGSNPNARTARTSGDGGGRGGGFIRPLAGEQTPLMLAARAGRTDVMKALIAAGADAKLKAQDGTTLLMSAVGSARVEAVRLAWEYDQDVRAVTTGGATLMHASVTGTANGATQEAQDRVCEVIRFLADKGTPLDERNAQGRTPIDLADGLPIDKAVDLFTELIVKSGEKPKSPSKREQEFQRALKGN
jgi:ankyrin repeat protein